MTPGSPRSGDIRERTVTKMDRMAGVLGHRASSFTFAWLASHRGRLRTLALGGHRLSLFVVWDSRAGDPAPREQADEDAIYRLTYGTNPPPGGVA